MLYGRLDGMREQAARRLTEELRDHRRHAAGPLPARLRRRDVHRPGRAVLGGGERPVLRPARRRRRRGAATSAGSASSTTSGDYDPLLMDWRAPAARPFYLATAASPQGVRRRRHLRTRQRTVTGLDDEVLDLATRLPQRAHHEELTGESALLAALNAGRTGRMRDIVATIQAEQDRDHPRPTWPASWSCRAARAPARPRSRCTGPRTCSTPTASSSPPAACCIVGPNATFLRYISQVLPSLAETGVLLRTPGDLFPGVVRPADRVAADGGAQGPGGDGRGAGRRGARPAVVAAARGGAREP